MAELVDRRLLTTGRLNQLRSRLSEAEVLANGRACVYATGSFGRGEASQHSDLDLFIVGKRDGRVKSDGKEGSLLTNLNEICLKAELISVTRELGIPDFSGDGQYLTHYPVHHFTKTLGTPEDDVTNTFTARLLLLLESRLLTCYSAILHLLATYTRHGTVEPSDVLSMIELTPTERLEWILLQPDLAHAHAKVDVLIGQYEKFLQTTNREETQLLRQFMDNETSRSFMRDASEFGDTLFEVLTTIGAANQFHRLLFV